MIIWNLIGRLVFWLTWPGIRLGLRFTTRTRGLVMSGNKVLVVKPWLSNGKWSLPGGGVKTNEDLLTGLLREVKEETGVRLKHADCKKIGNREYKSSGLRFVYALYKVRLTKAQTINRQKTEIAQAEWVSKDLLTKRNANSDVLDALKKST